MSRPLCKEGRDSRQQDGDDGVRLTVPTGGNYNYPRKDPKKLKVPLQPWYSTHIQRRGKPSREWSRQWLPAQNIVCTPDRGFRAESGLGVFKWEL